MEAQCHELGCQVVSVANVESPKLEKTRKKTVDCIYGIE